MLAPIAHSWVWQGIAPLVTDASFRQQINSCVWPSNQTHTIKVTTKIILSSAGPMSHACPVWPHPLPLAYYVILCIYVSIIIIIFGFLAAVALPPLSQYVNVNTKPRRASSFTSGLHKLWYPVVRDRSTWSKFGAHGEHGDVFLFSNLGGL